MTQTAAEGARHGLSLKRVTSRHNLREQVLGTLRTALIAAELRPGTVYSVPALAVELGVSPTPVREAMLELAQQGMFEAVPNKGFRVTALSDTELDELTDVRALIEPPTVAMITRTVESWRIKELYPLAEAIIDRADADDLVGFVDADLTFHLTLLALAGNTQLVAVVRDLRLRSRLYDLPAMADRAEVGTCAQGHVELLDVILAGDPEAAEQAMLAHLAQVRGVWAGRSSARALDRLQARAET